MYNKLQTLTNQEILDTMRKYDFTIQKEDNHIKISYLLKFKFNDYDLMMTIPYETTEEELKIFIIKTFEKRHLMDDLQDLGKFIGPVDEDYPDEFFEEYVPGRDYTGDLIDQMVNFRVKTLNMFRELTGTTNEKALEFYDKYMNTDIAERELQEKCEFEMIDGQVPDGCFDSLYDFSYYFEADLGEPDNYMFSPEGRRAYESDSLDLYFYYCLEDFYGYISEETTDDKFKYIPYNVDELKEYFEQKEAIPEIYKGEESEDIQQLALLKLLHIEGNYGHRAIEWALSSLLDSLNMDIDDIPRL